MLIYRDLSRAADSAVLLAELRRTADRLAASVSSSHDDAIGLLIDFGVFESAVADAICAEVDRVDPRLDLLREAARCSGHICRHTWAGRTEAARAWVDRLQRALAGIVADELPRAVRVSVPEGYAFYGLYPETYLEAVGACARAMAPSRALCIGLRSIGTSLSAVAGAALEETGCVIRLMTLRPRGHPFDRTPRMTPELERLIAQYHSAHVVLVDEGPGVSGSSLGGTARRIAELGVPDERIILLPSWRPDPDTLRSTAARAQWRRHPVFVGDFDEMIVGGGRLTRPGERLSELSAGRWRDYLQHGRAMPAVQPQHERRKFLVTRSSPEQPAFRIVRRFAGLGRYGRRTRCVSERLAESAMVPRPLGARAGFLDQEWLDGRPLEPGDIAPGLLDAVSSYLAWRHRELPSAPSTTTGELEEMVRVNVEEGLGPEWLRPLARVLGGSIVCPVERPVALDARLLPHEWLPTDAGYRKVDAIDHHDDHFLPGCHDAAWDVAAAAIELRLGRAGRRALIERYRALAADAGLIRRLPSHAVAYTAFRLGYCTLAVDATAGTADARRFQRLRNYYGARLRREIATRGALWDV